MKQMYIFMKTSAENLTINVDYECPINYVELGLMSSLNDQPSIVDVSKIICK